MLRQTCITTTTTTADSIVFSAFVLQQRGVTIWVVRNTKGHVLVLEEWVKVRVIRVRVSDISSFFLRPFK